MPAEFRYEWLSIPHIYQTPFYCYAYSFGQLLVLALYRRFQEEGEAFKPGYLRLLSYGGSARPEDILAEVGIDITDRAFWQGGFDLVARADRRAGRGVGRRVASRLGGTAGMKHRGSRRISSKL